MAPLPWDPGQTLLPLMWARLPPSFPSVPAHGSDSVTCWAALLSGDLLISWTALVADDSATRHTRVLGRASLLLPGISPLSRKGHDGDTASSQARSQARCLHQQGACHASSALCKCPVVPVTYHNAHGIQSEDRAAYSQWEQKTFPLRIYLLRNSRGTRWVAFSRGTERRRSPGSSWLRVCCELTGTRPASPASSLRLSVLIRKTHTCIVRRSLDYISHGLLALRLSNQEGWPIYDLRFFSVFATKL